MHITTEPGAGCAVRLCLPGGPTAVAASPAMVPRQDAVRPGSETVLLVEDESTVRRLAKRVLTRHGYNVLEASEGEEALRLTSRYEGKIDLVLTDVVMPRLGGQELVERLLADRPETRVLFMSGYCEDAIARHGALRAGTKLLEKPFSAEELAGMVREVLDAPTMKA